MKLFKVIFYLSIFILIKPATATSVAQINLDLDDESVHQYGIMLNVLERVPACGLGAQNVQIEFNRKISEFEFDSVSFDIVDGEARVLFLPYINFHQHALDTQTKKFISLCLNLENLDDFELVFHYSKNGVRVLNLTLPLNLIAKRDKFDE